MPACLVRTTSSSVTRCLPPAAVEHPMSRDASAVGYRPVPFPRSTLRYLGTRALFRHFVGDFDSGEACKRLPPDVFPVSNKARVHRLLMVVSSHAGWARVGCRA